MVDCDICRGSGVIRLPVHRELEVVQSNDDDFTLRESARQFACPECGTGGPVSRLYVVEQTEAIRTEYTNDYRKTIGETAARKIGSELFKAGMIASEERSGMGLLGSETHIKFSVGVVAPSHVATLEERIAKNNERLAQDLCATIKAEIRVWASDYTGDEGNISKGQACSAVDRAKKAFLTRP